MSDIVTFKMPDGTEVSNDPRFYQKDLQKQMDEQRKAFLAAVEPPGDTEPEDDDEDIEGYSTQSGAELKKEAQRRGLDIKGLRKKSELVTLLEEDDASHEPEEESEDEDPEETEES